MDELRKHKKQKREEPKLERKASVVKKPEEKKELERKKSIVKKTRRNK